MYKFIRQYSKPGYAEIGQQKMLRFAPVYLNGEQAIVQVAPFKCRAFFNEVLVGNEEKATKGIYGFTWKADYTLEPNTTRMALEFESEQEKLAFLFNEEWLNAIEERNNIFPTSFSATDDKHVVIVSGAKYWQSRCYLLSFYTFLMKCMMFKVTDDNWLKNILATSTNEANYIKQVQINRFEQFIRNIHFLDHVNSTVSGFKEGTNISTIHNGSGWVSTLNGTYKDNAYGAEAHKL